MIDNELDYEPSIESDNPIERKLARKYRLERRLQNSVKYFKLFILLLFVTVCVILTKI